MGEEEEKEEEDDWKERCLTVLFSVTYIKGFLITFNFLVFLFGWIIVILGVLMHIYQDSLFYGAILRDNPTEPILLIDRIPVSLILVGLVFTTLGFLGCCGACVESVCFLGVYSALLVMSMFSQVLVGILYASYRQQIQASLLRSMQYQVRYEYNYTAKFNNNSHSLIYRVTTAWDQIQINLNCCGAIGSRDYHDSAWFNHTMDSEGFVPRSCCTPSGDDPTSEVQADVLCQLDAAGIILDLDELHSTTRKGCHQAVIEWFVRFTPLIALLVAVDIIELISLLYALTLMHLVRRKNMEYSGVMKTRLEPRPINSISSSSYSSSPS